MRATQISRIRQVRINAVTLPLGKQLPHRTPSSGDRIVLNLFEGVTMPTIIERIVRLSPTRYHWTGSIEGAPGSMAVFLVNDDKVFGTVRAHGQLFKVRPIGKGLHAIAELDENAFPRDEATEPPPAATSSADGDPLTRTAHNEHDAQSGGTVIDVMVVYTDDAEAATTNIDDEIELAVHETNATYASSGIRQQVRLALTTKVDYAETGDRSKDLERLINPLDSVFGEVHRLREVFGVDLVALWVDSMDGCGLGKRPREITRDFADRGFSVVKRECADNLTPAHEWGHNMGARHDRFVEPDAGDSPFTYNYGYVDLTEGWRTIMAYSDECRGVPPEELAFGDFDGNDTTDVFRAHPGRRRWYVSFGGTSPWTELNRSSMATQELVFGDFDGNDTTDVLYPDGRRWFVSWNGRSGWRELNISDLRVGQFAIGDFNGDGVSDAFRADGERWFVSWGAAGEWEEVMRSGVTLANLAFGDFNGDGATDAFAADGTSWRVSWSGRDRWQELNRSTFRVADLAFGDFDGNDSSDVLRANGAQWLISWGGQTPWDTLNQSRLAVNQVRVGDFDGDGLSDIFRKPPGTRFWEYASGGAADWRRLSGGDCHKEPFWSNPNVLVNNRAAGVGITRSDSAADNRNTLNATAPVIASFRAAGSAWVSRGGTAQWERLATSLTDIAEAAFFDFDGDNADDAFRTVMGRWYTSSGANGPWREINSSGFELAQLAFGDFNNDDTTDVFRADGQRWFVSYGGTGRWTALNTSQVRREGLRFGDFDGDGATDVFRTDGRRWFYSPAGSGRWTELRNSNDALEILAFGDFNNDGVTDVFKADGRTWHVSWGGSGPWTELRRSPVLLPDIRFGDFDGDGTTDAFVADGQRWLISKGAAGDLELVNRSAYRVHDLAFADVDGDGATDVIRVMKHP